MSLEGKIANRTECSERNGKVKCEKCKREIDAPKNIVVSGNGISLYCKSYIGGLYFVYETQSGNAICYCSQKCTKKHNHRFRGK